jgi:hypothetical protein
MYILQNTIYSAMGKICDEEPKQETLEEVKPHSFCETPDEKCTMNYCDENGCQNRKKELVEPQEEPKQETLNKINNMSEEIKKQINLLQEEQTRVKQFINENNFNCTTAPYVIAKQYRDEIKKHIKILKMNLEN